MMHNNPFYSGYPLPFQFHSLKSEKPKTAVFWDAENVSGITESYMGKNIQSWLAMKYDVIAKFAFADWSGPYREVGNALYRIDFDLIHIPDNLKDSADCQMAAYIIDWLLRSPNTISYIIVSGDAIFEPTIKALQKQGKHVTVVSNPLVTRPETIIRADTYEDIGIFKPKAIKINPLKDEKEEEKTEEKLKQTALLRLQETIARLRKEGKPTYDRYVRVMLRRYNPDVMFGRPGYYNWDEAMTQAVFDGYIVYEGEGLGSQIKLSAKAAETSVDRSTSLENSLEKLGTIVESLYEKGEHTGMESIVHHVRKAKIDYINLGFSRFGDFVKAAEGRELVRIVAQNDSPPAVKPVYTDEKINDWYKTNCTKYFGERARVPPSPFITRTIQFLYQYDVGISKLEAILADTKIQESYDSILEMSGISFIPPYEKALLSVLLGTGISCTESLEIVNKELAPFGYELKCPE